MEDPEDPTFAIGHNSLGVAGEQLRAFIERIERLKAEVHDLQADIREIKKEAKANGFIVPVINHLIKIRAQDADDLAEFETLVKLYQRSLRG